MDHRNEKEQLNIADVIHGSFEKNGEHRFKTLLGLYKGNYWRLLLSGVFFTIKRLPAWILPIATANIINAATSKQLDAMQTIYLNVIVMIVLVLQNILTDYLYTMMHAKVIRNVESGLRASIIQKLHVLSISFQKNMQLGRLQSKIMRDVEAVQQLSSQVFVSGLNIVVNLLVALGVTLYKSPTVFLFFLVTVPVATVIVAFFRKKIKARNSEFRIEMESTSAKVVEMIELVPITRAHALEELETERLNRHFFQIAQKGIQLDLLHSIFGAMNWASFQIFQLLCLAFTGTLALQGKISAGDIVIYQSYFTMVVNAVSSIVTMVPAVTKGMESVSSIAEVLNAGEVEDNENKIKVERVEGAFSFQDVHFTYKDSDQSVLDGVNVEIASGETVAFVGESGSGKTTLLNLVIGFLRPTQGRILLDGVDMDTIDFRSFRQMLAVVPQQTILFEGSIKDNITYGAKDVSKEHLDTVLRAANLWDVVKQLPEGADTVIGEHGDKLSGGQRQRISIARALIRNPSVIVLDEATSALDSISEKKIQDSLAILCKGRTTFIVAHRLSTIRNADKIAVLEGGKCVEFGTYDELIAKKGQFFQMNELR